jgi:hypothetical protein
MTRTPRLRWAAKSDLTIWAYGYARPTPELTTDRNHGSRAEPSGIGAGFLGRQLT